jgi:hypothetical protein
LNEVQAPQTVSDALKNEPGADEFRPDVPLPGEEGYDAALAEAKKQEALDAVRQDALADAGLSSPAPDVPSPTATTYLVPAGLTWEILGYLSGCPWGEVDALVHALQESYAIPSQIAEDVLARLRQTVDVPPEGT